MDCINSSEKNKRNSCIDFIKMIACICVIHIHYPISGKAGGGINSIAQFAVLYFFMVSGYYLRGVNKDKLKKRIRHIGLLCLISTLLYLLFDYILFSISGHFGNWMKIRFSLGWLVRLLAINDLSNISAGHLWYLYALLYVYILYYLLSPEENIYRRLDIPLLIASIFLTIIKLVLFARGVNWHYTENWLFTAFPFVSIGYLVNKLKLPKIKWGYGFLIILLILVGYANGCKWGSLLGCIILSLFLLVLAIQYPTILNNGISRFGLKCSQNIYILHVAIGRLINIICDYLLKTRGNGTLIFLMTTVISCLVAWLLETVVKKIRIDLSCRS